MRFLVTGTAGFIGFHVARRLLLADHTVVGLDGMTAYYDVALKRKRHRMLLEFRASPSRNSCLRTPMPRHPLPDGRPQKVVHLAAQAGVRYSLENPRAYIDANLIGTFNVLEACRHHPVTIS